MKPLVRQAKLGISYRVKVPIGQGLANHPYRVLQLLRRLRKKKSNEIIEAYTENHVGHKGDRTPGSLIQPR